MKAKVLVKFIDKHTSEIHKVGDTITISEDRFKEILEVGPLVKKVETAKKTTKKVEEKAAE